SGLFTFEHVVRERGHELDDWHPYRGDPAPDPARYGAAFVLGGTPHPDQDVQHAWLGGERRLLRGLVEQEVPTLAICLGGQLLAQALGGRAHRLDAPEVGWYEIELEPEARRDPLLRELPPRFHAFEWHEYGFSVPDGARSLARSPLAPN